MKLGIAWGEIEKYIPQWGYFGTSKPQCGSNLEIMEMYIICFGVSLGQCWCLIYNYEVFPNIDPGLSRLGEIGYNLGNKLQIPILLMSFYWTGYNTLFSPQTKIRKT